MELTSDTLLHERYKIVRKLGQGGMGAVYEAYDTTLETKVAVKCNFSPAQESVEQFLQEARLLAALKHPNLPRVTDYFVIGSEQYLVMDFIPGKDLNERIKADGAFELDEVLSLSEKLCDALAYLHRQNPPVIHRDVKPANIKITPEGNVFLVDFGIAKASGSAQETASGASGYTPGFAPPEQYGQGRTGGFSDQFSLAATIYTLLATIKPADSIERLMGKSTLIPIQELSKNVKPNVADALSKALALKPENRFASILDFRKALMDPTFKLSEIERQATSANITQRNPRKEDSQSLTGATILVGEKKKRKVKGWVIGLIISAGVLCIGLIVSVVFIIAFRGGKLDFLKPAADKPVVVIPTQAETTAPVVVEPTELGDNIPTEEMPEETEVVEQPVPTVEVTPTSQPEMVGGSGVIVFVSDRGGDGFQQIWTMRVSQYSNGDILAEDTQQLTFDPGDKDNPVWSPDGKLIAYSGQGTAANGKDIWVMNADGSDQVNLTSYNGDEFDPVWSPDGKSIVFTHHSRSEGSLKILQLVKISSEGFNRLRISEDFIESQPTFSPDGNYLVYVIHASSHEYLYIRNRFDDFENPEKFDVRELFGELGEVADPEISPDGKSLVYTRLNGNNQQIVMITFSEITSFGARNIQSFDVSTEVHDFGASWSDDMRWLAFTSSRDGGDEEIYIMTTAGRPQINLTNRVGVDRSPDWLPLP